MKCELVQITTKDALVHHGAYFAPSNPGKKAILWIHGLTGRFYSDPKLLNLFSEACDKQGMGLAAFNNRGHDYITSAHRLDSNDTKGYVYENIGASVEKFTDSVADIDASISFLHDKGFTEIILVGHSTGANKVCYYAGTVGDPRVAGVVLAGPMSDRYSVTDEVTHENHKAIMEQKIKDGKGDEILIGFDFLPLTPHRWMSLMTKGSPEDVFNYRDEKGALSTFEQITMPLCVMFAGSDEHADRPIPEIKRAFDSHSRSRHYQSMAIADCDHGFTGKEQVFVSAVVDWTSSL